MDTKKYFLVVLIAFGYFEMSAQAQINQQGKSLSTKSNILFVTLFMLCIDTYYNTEPN